MRHSAFIKFFAPTAIAMALFIALPLVSIVVQSLHQDHEKVLKTVENCGPFGCTTETIVDHEAMEQFRDEQPLGKFTGLATYFDRAHLAVDEVAEAWNSTDSMIQFFNVVTNLPFYKALTFTLTYTFVSTPILIVLGFFVALTVNSLRPMWKGVVIFISLLPSIVTPLIGALILFWMIDARGIIGASLQWIFNDPDLSLKASTGLTWIMLITYGVWHATPFAFIVFYAGLQTLPKDTLESAMIDGATRWQRVRFVVIPHMMPLVTFVTLILLMDNFRVLEPIVGFNAEAHATSLSWIIYNDLSGIIRLLSSASATSVLTIIGVAILLFPVLIRTWRDFRRGE